MNGGRRGRQHSTVSVCYFTDSLEPSGVGVHLLHLLRRLDPERYRASLVCPSSPDGDRLLNRAAELGAHTYALTVREPHDTEAIERLHEVLLQEDVLVFHSQVGISWEGFVGLRTAHAAGVPVRIVTEHLPYLLTHPGQIADHRETIPLALRVIAVSEGSRRTFLAQGYPSQQFVCIHNGVELPVPPNGAEAQRVRHELGLDARAPLLLTVGRLTAQKGHDVLLEAVPAVQAQHADARFVCVGEGPELPRLQAQAASLGVTQAVRFLGHRSDVPALLAAADLFVLPSRFEGHPLAALEASALGVAVVGTRVCGLEEAVVPGETGLLVAPDRPEELASAILELLADGERRRRMGEAGRRFVARHYTAQQMAERTMALYDQLLREAR